MYHSLLYNGNLLCRINVTIQLNCRCIIGDHEGYCSGAENEEYISIVKVRLPINISCCKYLYVIFLGYYNRLDYLTQLGLNYKELSNNEDTYVKSKYCYSSSKYNLRHENLIIMNILEDIFIDRYIELAEETRF